MPARFPWPPLCARTPEGRTRDARDKILPVRRSGGCYVVELYNNERPQQALKMRCPAEHYAPSTRPYRGLPDPDYPFHDKTVTVTTCGRICFNRQKINLSAVFAGQSVGIKQVSDEIWLVSFMDYDLGYFDRETCRLEPIENPFGPKVLPLSPDLHLAQAEAKPPARAPT